VDLSALSRFKKRLLGMKMKTMVMIGVVSAIVLGIVAAVVSVSVSGSGSSAEQLTSNGPFKAVVVLNVGTAKSGVSGVLELTQENANAPVRITGSISNLTPEGNHGFHVHESGDIRGDTPCTSTGGHFNPHGKTHGSPVDNERHVGDLGNIIADSSGNAAIDITDDKISLTGGNSVVGRAIVVHEKKDDLGKGGDEGSLKTGNAGGRIACGLIGTIFQK